MSPLETARTIHLSVWDDGSIRVGCSRVPLDSLVREFARGATAEQIQDDFPSLSLREIYAAISYYLDCQEQVDDYLRRREQEADRVRVDIEDPTRIDVLRRRIRERALHLKAKP